MAMLALLVIAWEESKRSARPQPCTERGRRFRPTAARRLVCKRGAADCSCEGQPAPTAGSTAQ
eukprot:4625907-Alexandrium_andersonii.AAC.1